ncbi:MAG: FAD-dependent oxidoreductase, partial [Clostridiaceae bacterium]|nr:FAD-dependent oxidoreductase [Clostridiaceae bacterium]
SAKESGLSRILIVERDVEPGGILNQCIHNGFGLHYFGQELTGPEYAARLTDRLAEGGIDLLCDTMVLSIEPGEVCHRVCLMSASQGYRYLESDTVILAMGCRERTRGAIGIPGTRASGIMTAGTAQRYVNMEGYMVGRRVLILGSGDVGLIMARRMTLEGAQVLACVEMMPYPGGLARNLVQCLDDYDIPLLLSHTVTKIEGKNRVERVIVEQVDSSFQPVVGSAQYFEVDTILLSVGLIPENELTRAAGIAIDPKTSGPVVDENKETSVKGIFACGNVLHVHDLVDYVTEESEEAGRFAASYVLDKEKKQDRRESGPSIQLVAGQGIAYTIPQKLNPGKEGGSIRVFFRVCQPHKRPKRVTLRDGEELLASFRRPYMAPAEMEQLKIRSELIGRVKGDRLTLSIEE